MMLIFGIDEVVSGKDDASTSSRDRIDSKYTEILRSDSNHLHLRETTASQNNQLITNPRFN